MRYQGQNRTGPKPRMTYGPRGLEDKRKLAGPDNQGKLYQASKAAEGSQLAEHMSGLKAQFAPRNRDREERPRSGDSERRSQPVSRSPKASSNASSPSPSPRSSPFEAKQSPPIEPRKRFEPPRPVPPPKTQESIFGTESLLNLDVASLGETSKAETFKGDIQTQGNQG